VSGAASLSYEDIARIGSAVGRVSSMLGSILALVRTNGETDESIAIAALCEKAGFLSDRCAIALGNHGTFGSWEEWAEESEELIQTDPEFKQFMQGATTGIAGQVDDET
jgi:hypothetical protein